MTDSTSRGPRSLKDLLGSSSPLDRLRSEAEKRLALADFLKDALPESLREAVLSCNLRDDGTLVVSTTGPAWAARLRFEGDALLSRCRERHPAAARVRVRVATI